MKFESQLVRKQEHQKVREVFRNKWIHTNHLQMKLVTRPKALEQLLNGPDRYYQSFI